MSHGPLGAGRMWVTAPSEYFDRFQVHARGSGVVAVACPLPAVVFREAARHWYRGEQLRCVGGCWLVLRNGCPLVSSRRWPRFSPRAPGYCATIGWAPGSHPPHTETWDDAIERWLAREKVAQAP